MGIRTAVWPRPEGSDDEIADDDAEYLVSTSLSAGNSGERHAAGVRSLRANHDEGATG